MSAYGSKPPSAQLLEYLPEQGEMVVRGDAVSELKRAGVYREGEGQMKIGHMLYQFDCETGEIRSLRVGAVGGHISRNLLSNDRGHVYVPRLTYKGAAELAASLVEFSRQAASSS